MRVHDLVIKNMTLTSETEICVAMLAAKNAKDLISLIQRFHTDFITSIDPSRTPVTDEEDDVALLLGVNPYHIPLTPEDIKLYDKQINIVAVHRLCMEVRVTIYYVLYTLYTLITL